MIDQRIEWAVGELQARARHLRDDMDVLLARVEREGNAVHVNRLGEVQTAGLEVDRLCAQVASLREARDILAAESSEDA